jgi:hypothetical protein
LRDLGSYLVLLVWRRCMPAEQMLLQQQQQQQHQQGSTAGATASAPAHAAGLNQ